MKTIKPFRTRLLLLTMLASVVVLTGAETGLMNEITKTSMLEKKDQYFSISDIPAAKLEMLAHKNIYFGHHSVGDNIIDGINDLMIENPNLEMNIVETTNESDFQVGLFAHSRVGENMDPQSKIEGFVRFIDNGIGRNADIATFKFCYVDIFWETDVDRLLNTYHQSMAKLRKKYPSLQIIHFTSPLTQQRTTWKHLVKKLLHINDPWRYGPNIRRNEYNKMLVEKYQGKDLIFDIAAIESTYPDGTRSTFTIDDNIYYSLVPEYTSDGGHLNEIGRKIVAEKLIIYLANLN